MDSELLQDILIMIETAQRAGRSEREIVAIVEAYFESDADEPDDVAAPRRRAA
jgi:hypothetical protein